MAQEALSIGLSARACRFPRGVAGKPLSGRVAEAADCCSDRRGTAEVGSASGGARTDGERKC